MNPVAMIFAREISDPLTSLVKKIDEATVKNKGRKMGSFIVFLSDDESLADKLKTLATKQGISSCVLSIDNPAGHPAYTVAKDADVTVVLYNKRTVAANFSFRKGQLNEAAVERIVKDVSKIVP
jgi:hypothetical protein